MEGLLHLIVLQQQVVEVVVQRHFQLHIIEMEPLVAQEVEVEDIMVVVEQETLYRAMMEELHIILQILHHIIKEAEVVAEQVR
jgi:hypothetical protein